MTVERRCCGRWRWRLRPRSRSFSRSACCSRGTPRAGSQPCTARSSRIMAGRFRLATAGFSRGRRDRPHRGRRQSDARRDRAAARPIEDRRRQYRARTARASRRGARQARARARTGLRRRASRACKPRSSNSTAPHRSSRRCCALPTWRTGCAKADFRDVDLAEVCAQTLEFYEPLAEAKSDRHDERGDTRRSWIRGDEDLLREAVSNLVDNAVKFTPAGGAVRLAVGTVQGRPRLEVSRHRTWRRASRPRPHFSTLLSRASRRGRRPGMGSASASPGRSPYCMALSLAWRTMRRAPVSSCGPLRRRRWRAVLYRPAHS